MAGHPRLNCIGVLAITLSACGGGGGGGAGISGTPTAPPAPTALPNPLPAPVTKPSNENFDTGEYRNSSAAVGSNVLPAWQAGASGKGVTLGFVDTGLIPSLSDFSGRIDPQSRDVNGSRPMDDLWGHGTAVAGIAAAAHDGKGMEGIAYEATIFMAKADQGCPDHCVFPTDAVAKGIDAARMAGAKVINLSLAGSDNSEIRAAVGRAVNAGIVIVIGAGNSGSAPSDLAMQLASFAPEQVIIVGGLGVTNPDGTINYDVPSIYTTPAGSSQASFLTAPGWLNSATYFRVDGSIDKLSGTSFAAPVVTGAIALIAQAFPMLTPRQIVLLLYTTADDLGIAGMDTTFGRGRLNIGRAFLPVGTVRLAGAMIALPQSLGTLPSAAGDAARRHGLKATILDTFDRPFTYNLATRLSEQVETGPLARALVIGNRTGWSTMGPMDIAFTVDSSGQSSFSKLGFSPEQQTSARLLAAKVISRLTDRSSLVFGYGMGSATLLDQLSERANVVFMLSDAAPADLGFHSSGVASIAYQHRIGAWRLTAAGEKGSIQLSQRAPDASYSLMSWSAEWSHPRGFVRLGSTWLIEPRTVLGAKINSMFGSGETQTWFSDLQAEQGLGHGWSVAGAYRRGWTSFPGGHFATSAMSLDITKTGVLRSRDGLALRLSQPLRIKRGAIGLTVPVSWDYLTETTTEARRSLSLIPSGRELFAEANYMQNLSTGWFSLNAYARRQPGHVQRSDIDLGVAARANLKF